MKKNSRRHPKKATPKSRPEAKRLTQSTLKKTTPPVAKKVEEKKDQGWQEVSKWYDSCVGSHGHFYHRELILPKLEKLLSLSKVQSVLDLGCGQGILERQLPSSCRYVGLDASSSLIKSAQTQSKSPFHQFIQADLSKPYRLYESFDIAIFLLSLQNIPHADIALETAAKALTPSGKIALVLNHPCFRIPRQSQWQENSERQTLMRSMHSYLSPLEIPIQAHPGKESSQTSISYHHSLTDLFAFFEKASLRTLHLEEWTCSKTSTGGKARMENRARKEFPLFLFLLLERR